MRIACVHIAGLAIQAALIENPHLKEQPLIIGGSPVDDAPVVDASVDAMACGVKIGMPLRKACSLCPGATFLPPDDAMCDELFHGVLDVLDGFSPVVENEAPGCAYLDLTGVKNEQETAGNILRDVSIMLRATLGISCGKFFSRVAAVTSKTETPVIISRGCEKDFIAPFPVDLLPCSYEAKERLKLLGIKRIGQLAGFTRDDLAAQFGAEGRMMHDISRGRDDTPLVPRPRDDTLDASIELFPPSVDYLEILASCRAMLEELLLELRNKGRPCREIILKLSYESTSSESRLIFKEPTYSETAVTGRLRACLENMPLASPVTGVTLRLVPGSESGRQAGLWDGGREGLVKAGEKLRRRFGRQPLKRVEVVDAGAVFPERRTRLVEMEER